MHTIDHGPRSYRITARINTAAGCCLVAAIMIAGGCKSDAQNGALLGGAIGAGAGAVIGHNSGSGKGWAGAGIGAAAGALGGYIVGNEMDKDKARKQNPNDYSRYEY